MHNVVALSTGSSLEVPCPASSPTISYWVELIVGTSCVGTTTVDQRVENFTNIRIFFLFDVAITNTYILLKSCGSCPFKDLKSFRLQLAKDLIGEYCSY